MAPRRWREKLAGQRLEVGPAMRVCWQAGEESARVWSTHVSRLRWWFQAAEAGGGAFHRWRVLLCVKSAVRAGFKRLLEAGGATVVRDT